MASIVKILRVAADPNRLRILLLLRAEELSVAELQEILAMGQSTISTHLSQLKQAGLVEDRRTGKSILYSLKASPPVEDVAVLTGPNFSHADSATKSAGPSGPQAAEKLHPVKGTGFSPYVNAKESGRALAPEGRLPPISPEIPGSSAAQPLGAEGRTAHATPTTSSFIQELLARAQQEIPEALQDQSDMRRVLKKRQDKMRSFFDSVAGRLAKDYVPGKSWKSLAEALLSLMPPMVIADLGAGEGASALLLAQRAKRVIAVDSSAKMIEVGREQALRHGVKNVEYRLGDIESLPIEDAQVDLVWISQSLHHALHPDRALSEAHRILIPGGRIVILDLLKHRFEEARDIYADEWLGFTETELESMLEKSSFTNIQTSVIDKEPEPPQFQTLLAVANKPS